MKRNGVSVRQNLFFPRVVFLASDCELDEELRKKKEMVSHSQMDAFFRSFKEGYVAWISDAMTPSWLTGEWATSDFRGDSSVLESPYVPL